MRRIVQVNQFKPVAGGDFPLVQIQQLAEIVSQPQTKTHLPCCLVAFKNKSGEEASRTMLDCQRIRQPQIVFRDDIGVDEGHYHLLSAGCPHAVSQCSRSQSQSLIAAIDSESLTRSEALQRFTNYLL